jgi:acyl dehydratase
MAVQSFSFSQIHIDAARNSTDDFNPFHDKHRWQKIRDNPFRGPIVLGFQLECLLESQIRRFREQRGELETIRSQGLRYSNYQLTFADVVRTGDPISVEIKKSQFREGDNPMLGNRVVMRKETSIVLMGHKWESRRPLFSAQLDDRLPEILSEVPDRSHLCAGEIFLKRKYMNTGNAKNFLSGSLVEQADYFDELEDKADFPETFPTALISCALLERAHKEHHDFERQPMVYTAHEISVDREGIAALHSNDVLHILVSLPGTTARSKSLGKLDITQQVFHCWGLTSGCGLLFFANIYMALLEDVRKDDAAARRAGSRS